MVHVHAAPSKPREARAESAKPEGQGTPFPELPRPPRAAAWIGTALLVVAIVGLGLGLVAWRRAQTAEAAAIQQPEPVQAITAAEVTTRPYQPSTTAIGTVLSLRSVTLRNEEPGTVVEARLETGAVVEEGDLLIALDVSVEQAELRALDAQAALAETLLARIERASANQGASEADLDRARAERDIALANVARTRAQIERKTILAPFRARIGLSDVHVGQYLDRGTSLTTLQGVDEAVHVDFSVTQDAAADLEVGQPVTVLVGPGSEGVQAEIVALDARVDPATRNTLVRARVAGEPALPGSSVRVRVPLGAARDVLAVPVSALRKSPAGDLVFVLQADGTGGTGEPGDGALRAHQRRVIAGAVLGDWVAIESGLELGERVAASGSFKLFEGARAQVVPDAQAAPSTGSQN